MTDDTEDNPPAVTEIEAMRWMVQAQRALAFNLGYLDVPTHEEDALPEMTWQQLSALHEVEYTLLNDFVVRRMMEGEKLTPEYLTAPKEDD